MRLPSWAERIAQVVPHVRAEQLTRVRPPAGHVHREAAVLVLFGPGEPGPDGEPAGEVVLLERSADLRSHPGQVAFPGGSLDPGEDAVGAALREAHEETGLDPDSVRVLGTLPPLFLPPSEFTVTPVVAWWGRPHDLVVGDPLEVAQVVRVPLPELLDPANRFVTVLSGGFRGPGFEAGGLFVWGFTAGLLSRLLLAAAVGGPWDHDAERPVPRAQLRDLRLPGQVAPDARPAGPDGRSA